MKTLTALLLLTILPLAQAQEVCSRVAVINQQEILVDNSTNQKGEGLRFYIERDPVAKEYLDIYQKNGKPTWATALVGTLGTGLIVGGVFSPSKDDSDTLGQRELLVGLGVLTLGINYFVYYTLGRSNESNLERAIQEYNKRNSPKIYFSPIGTNSFINSSDSSISLGYSLGINKDF